MSKREPWRGQMATHSSGSHSPSQRGPSSWEQRPRSRTGCRCSCRRRSRSARTRRSSRARAGAPPRGRRRRWPLVNEIVRSSPWAHSSGSGVPLDLCSATFRTPRPRIAHFRRTGVSGSRSPRAAPPSASAPPRPRPGRPRAGQHRGRRLEIAQPRPSKPTSASRCRRTGATRSPRRRRADSAPRPAHRVHRGARARAGSCSGRG